MKQAKAVDASPPPGDVFDWMEPAIVAVAYVLAVLVRCFSAAKYETVFQEFEPFFNYRATEYYVEHGWYAFQNWFDDQVWYPLGRLNGGSMYPGLIVMTARVHGILSFVTAVELRTVCLYIPPFIAATAVIATYFLCKEALADTKARFYKQPAKREARSRQKAGSAGALAAGFIAIVPAFINHTTVGSYDNEGLLVVGLLSTYFCWVRAVNTGDVLWALLSAGSYGALSNSHGGYLIAANTVPLYVLVMLCSGRYSTRLHLSYSVFYVAGTLLSMHVQSIGFQPVLTAEHFLALLAFAVIQAYAVAAAVAAYVPLDMRSKYWAFVKSGAFRAGFVSIVGVWMAKIVLGGRLDLWTWTDRFYAVVDPTFGKKNLPIMASVSEHQPITWASYFFDLHILAMLIPAGLYHCFKDLTDGKIFLIVVAVTSVYLSAVMVKLIIIVAPIACILGALAVSETLSRSFGVIKSESAATPLVPPKAKRSDEKQTSKGSYEKEGAVVVCLILSTLLLFFTWHCTWVASVAYASPTLFLTATQNDGTKVLFDDFREAYNWLDNNTRADAKVLSWWDYGYHLTAMANRTTIVDNNAWNNTHVATTALAMVSSEEDAYPILLSLDVDYVMVTFGGVTGYSSDDMNKFPWMVRIAQREFPSLVNEKQYYVGRKRFHVGKEGKPALLNSLAYSLCYHRFGKINTDVGKASGYDRVRRLQIGRKLFQLKHLEEVLTTEHWLVRIYKVKKPANMGHKHLSP